MTLQQLLCGWVLGHEPILVPRGPRLSTFCPRCGFQSNGITVERKPLRFIKPNKRNVFSFKRSA